MLFFLFFLIEIASFNVLLFLKLLFLILKRGEGTVNSPSPLYQFS
jgi:hypothetical protein